MENTGEIIHHLNDMSSGTLKHAATLQILLETAQKAGLHRTLSDLAFDAKFCHKTHGIMKRIGADGEGYEKLAREFTDAIERCRKQLEQILSHIQEAEKQEIGRKFLAMTPAGMQNLLGLLHDLSWYKNYQIDAENRLS